MSTAFQVRAELPEVHKRRRPIKDPAYLRFVRSLPCVACGGTRSIEVMHVGPRGLGQKVDDKDGLPGCRWCHKELHQVGPVAFCEKYVLAFPALIRKLNDFYDANLRGTY